MDCVCRCWWNVGGLQTTAELKDLNRKVVALQVKIMPRQCSSPLPTMPILSSTLLSISSAPSANPAVMHVQEGNFSLEKGQRKIMLALGKLLKNV